VVLHLGGTITIGPEADALESLLLDLLGQKTRKLIFDLAGMDEIEASPCFSSAAFSERGRLADNFASRQPTNRCSDRSTLPSFIFVIRASGSCGFTQSRFDSDCSD
jgi:hypothetical protein